MKAIVCERYGPPEVLELREIPKPVPRANQILIRIRATTVTAGDWRVRSLTFPPGFALIGRLMLGVTRPRQPILGTEFAGEIESVGPDVTRFRAGDHVYGFAGARMGCYAGYRVMHQDGCVAVKPPNLSFEEAAALSFGGTTALDFFRRGTLRPGERVLVNGASGGVGTAAVQLAKHAGAHVTGVCSTANVGLVRSLGADEVVDYTKEDFTSSGVGYDVIVDTAGTAPFARSRASLADDGRLLLVLGGLRDMMQAPLVSLISRTRIVAGPAAERPEDVRLLGQLAAEGRYRPVIDRRYPFEQMVEAHRYVDQGHKKGNVVVTV